MPHGTPDYGVTAPKGTTYTLQDLAELAVRLGSPMNFDRRGDVIDYMTFSQGLGSWIQSGYGAGNTAYISAYRPQYGSLLAILHTGSGAGGYSRISDTLFYPVLGRMGLEVAFVPVLHLLDLQLTVLLYTGIAYTVYTVQYRHTTGKIQVQHTDLDWYNVGAPGIQLEGSGSYVTIKIVFDPVTGKYHRVLFNGDTYQASAYAGVSVDYASRKYMAVGVTAVTDGAVAIDVSLGHVIITQNEPI